MRRLAFVSMFLAAVMLVGAGCASAPPPGSIPTAQNGGAGGAAGDASGKSGTITPNTALAMGAASDATSLGVQWTRQATTPVSGDVYQLVAGDASLLPEDSVEKAYASRVAAALAAAAQPGAGPEAGAAADKAIADLRAYHEARLQMVTSTGRAGPQIMLFVGTKITHGTTSADVPSPEVVAELANLAASLSDLTGAAKGTKPPAAK